MRKNVLAAALAGLALPALALAAQPLLIRVGGQKVPMREVVQVMHTAAGPVYVHTWSWTGPRGAATVQVSETRGTRPPMPAWAMAQMRAMQAQMRLIEAMVNQRPMPAVPVPSMFAAPVLLALPGQAPVEVRWLQPMIRLRAVPVPTRVLVIVPARARNPHAAPAPTSQPRGHLV